MAYKGDHATRSLERVSSWAWSGRFTPRAIMAVAVFFFLVGMIIGTISIIAQFTIPISGFNAIMLFSFVIAARVLGRGDAGTEMLDEWQKTLRARAFLWGANITLIVVGAFLLYLALAEGRAGWWAPGVRSDWLAIAFMTFTLWITGCTFAAGWLTPSYAGDIDFDD